MHANRADGATWGLLPHSLPTATAASVLERGYNPLTPFALHRHHPVFDGFGVQQAPFESDYLRDFVGTKTMYNYDCGDWGRNRRFHLSRRIPCNRHDAFRAMDVASFGLPLLGDLPVMDSEYYEWIFLLQAVRSYVEASDPGSDPSASRPFVIAEFGARYGTRAARGARAVVSKLPGAQVHVCAVEGDHHVLARPPPLRTAPEIARRPDADERAVAHLVIGRVVLRRDQAGGRRLSWRHLHVE